jgi:hypothetical protein
MGVAASVLLATIGALVAMVMGSLLVFLMLAATWDAKNEP